MHALVHHFPEHVHGHFPGLGFRFVIDDFVCPIAFAVRRVPAKDKAGGCFSESGATAQREFRILVPVVILGKSDEVVDLEGFFAVGSEYRQSIAFDSERVALGAPCSSVSHHFDALRWVGSFQCDPVHMVRREQHREIHEDGLDGIGEIHSCSLLGFPFCADFNDGTRRNERIHRFAPEDGGQVDDLSFWFSWNAEPDSREVGVLRPTTGCREGVKQ